MGKNSSRQKFGFILLAVSILIIGSVAAYAYYESQKPENKVLGDVMILWHIGDYDELLGKSDLIVTATVTKKTGIWGTTDGEKPSRFRQNTNLQNHGEIWTEYTYQPDEILKGNTTTIIGRSHGGTVDGYTQNASEMVDFEVGDKVLLFLKTNSDQDGNRILWYYSDWPVCFIEIGDGVFTNEAYGDISIEILKEDIAAQETKNSVQDTENSTQEIPRD